MSLPVIIPQRDIVLGIIQCERVMFQFEDEAEDDLYVVME